jgi:hypothetical protein
MEKTLTLNDAYVEFMDWIKTQPAWKEMPRQRKQYLYGTRIAVNKGRDVRVRITTILNEYGAPRYEVRELVIVKD